MSEETTPKEEAQAFVEKVKALPMRTKIYSILGAVLVVAGIIWGGLELALAGERSAFEEKADALVEEKVREMMKTTDAETYKIEKNINGGYRDTLEYTVTFDERKPVRISAGIMPTHLLDVFSDYTPRIQISRF